jgi:hypothetical protein
MKVFCAVLTGAPLMLPAIAAAQRRALGLGPDPFRLIDDQLMKGNR